MAHHPMEAAEITQGATSLVCNFGAIADYEAMLLAGRKAHELDHAIVVDPVGVSGSTYRREKMHRIYRGGASDLYPGKLFGDTGFDGKLYNDNRCGRCTGGRTFG